MLLSIVLARTLSQEDFGRYSFCMFFLMLFSMLTRHGLESVLLRYGGAAWHKQDLKRFRGYASWAVSITVRNSIGMTLLGGLLLWLGGKMHWINPDLMIWFLVALLPWSMLYAISSMFKAAHQASSGIFFEVGTVHHLTWIAIVFLSISQLGISVKTVAITTFVCTTLVCMAGLLLLKQKRLWPQYNEQMQGEKRAFLQACQATAIIVVMQMLANNGGVFFLGVLWNQQEVAVFSAPARIAMATILFTNLVTLIISPRLSGHYEAGEELGFQQMLQKGCLVVFATNFPTLISIGVFAPQIMILMGDSYVKFWPILTIIAVGQSVGVIAGLAPTVLCMTGMERIWSRVTFCTTMFCIFLTALLSYSWGATGAAIGAATYQASQNWVAAITVRYYHQYWTVPRISLGKLRRILSRCF